MKKTIYILLTGILIAGCSIQDEPTGPASSAGLEKSWVKLNTVLQIEEQITVCQTFNGETGGIFNFNDKPDDVKINGKLTIPAGAFAGSLEICAILDGQTTFLTFSPTLDFINPVSLNLTYKDVNLTGIDPSELDFYYIDDEGNLLPAEYDSKEIDVEKGTLKITGVKIYHFSRYGWAK